MFCGQESIIKVDKPLSAALNYGKVASSCSAPEDGNIPLPMILCRYVLG